MELGTRRSGAVAWMAWLLAGTLGTLLPVLPAAMNLPLPLGLEDASAPSSLVLAAIGLPIFQCAVLGALRGRLSGWVLAWVPVTFGATLIAFAAIVLWGITVPRYLVSVSAIQTSLPSGFPLLQVIFALFGLTQALVVGLAQGIVLARIFESKPVVARWWAANLIAALSVGIVLGIRLQEPLPSDAATLTVIFVTNTLITGALYAAVTGVALVGIAGRERHQLRSPVRRAT